MENQPEKNQKPPTKSTSQDAARQPHETPVPSESPPTPPEPEVKESKSATPQTEAIGHGKTSLVIDDEPTAVTFAQNTLESAGFSVAVASNGEEGLAKASMAKPDIILLDILMPGMDGFTFFKELKKSEETKDIPVVILTARKNMEDSFMALGAENFITKPTSAKVLLERIKPLTSRQRTPSKKEPGPPPDEKKPEGAKE